MGRGANWTSAEVTRVRELRLSGLTYVEIHKLFPHRTPVAIKDAIGRWQPIGSQQRADAPPIGMTDEDRWFANDAKIGSAKLREEILRVFGPQRMAA